MATRLGRPPLFGKAMTPAIRQYRYRVKRGATTIRGRPPHNARAMTSAERQRQYRRDKGATGKIGRPRTYRADRPSTSAERQARLRAYEFIEGLLGHFDIVKLDILDWWTGYDAAREAGYPLVERVIGAVKLHAHRPPYISEWASDSVWRNRRPLHNVTYWTTLVERLESGKPTIQPSSIERALRRLLAAVNSELDAAGLTAERQWHYDSDSE